MSPLPGRGTDLPLGTLREVPEDFVVDEIPAYGPSGEGDHLFIHLRKRGHTTTHALARICALLGADPRAASAAGQKDRHAVTTQTVSVFLRSGMTEDAIRAALLPLEQEGIWVLGAARHVHKLRPGHLVGNRFAIVVRHLRRDALPEVRRVLEETGRSGLPNHFGEQRFGREGDNVSRALSWLRGETRAPRDPRLRRMHWSSVQSAIFNDVLDARLANGTWNRPLRGDLLKLHESGGMFLCADPDVDGTRADAFELSPTGPMVGDKMRWPEGAPEELERDTVGRLLGDNFDLAKTRALGEGTRRPLRIQVGDLTVTELDTNGETGTASLRVSFVLPKGAYATSVLARAIRWHEPRSGEPASTGSDIAIDTGGAAAGIEAGKEGLSKDD